MKQVCLLCERTSPDNNLYCQEVYCPAEMSPTILGHGEWLGDIEIVKPIIILRSAVLYEATHREETVLLKVAHPGEENKERLKREAELLKTMQLNKEQSEFFPTLLPPYVGTTIEVDAYGKTMLKGHLLYFCLFQFFKGKPLRDHLTENSQLWINHVGWLTISLAHAVALMHSKGFLHLGLSPENVLVHFDKKSNTPRILLFDLGVASDRANLETNWYSFGLPAYTAPELVNGKASQAHYTADVYGLGLILYELLVGEPTYTFKLRSDNEVYNAIKRNQRIRMNRYEDVRPVAQIAHRAVDKKIAQRQSDATVLAKDLMDYFGKVPAKKKNWWPKQKTIMIFVATLLAFAFLIVLIIALDGIVLLTVSVLLVVAYLLTMTVTWKFG